MSEPEVHPPQVSLSSTSEPLIPLTPPGAKPIDFLGVCRKCRTYPCKCVRSDPRLDRFIAKLERIRAEIGEAIEEARR